MMDYRCYHLNPVGRFIAVEVYQCSTDAEACDRAHVIVANQQWGAFELWQLDRKVACPGSMGRRCKSVFNVKRLAIV